MEGIQPFSDLSPEQRQEHWAESERQVRVLIERLHRAGALDEETRALCIDFADHNEMGVALESIAGFIVEHRSAVPSGVPSAIQALAERMSMTSLPLSAIAELPSSG